MLLMMFPRFAFSLLIYQQHFDQQQVTSSVHIFDVKAYNDFSPGTLVSISIIDGIFYNHHTLYPSYYFPSFSLPLSFSYPKDTPDKPWH
jgi:hypothetical protein